MLVSEAQLGLLGRYLVPNTVHDLEAKEEKYADLHEQDDVHNKDNNVLSQHVLVVLEQALLRLYFGVFDRQSMVAEIATDASLNADCKDEHQNHADDREPAINSQPRLRLYA